MELFRVRNKSYNIKVKRIKKSKKVLDWFDNLLINIKVFFDFKYRRERRNKVLAVGELDSVPVEKALKKDEDNLKRDSLGCAFKYVKTKGGAVVVTPASLRQIREDYPGAIIVDAAIKD